VVSPTIVMQPRTPQPPQPPQPPAAPAAPAPPVILDGAEVPAPGVRIETRDGQTITLPSAGGGGTNPSFPSFPSESGIPEIPPNIYSLAQGSIIGLTLVLIAFPVFGFLKALVNRRANTQQALPSRDTTDRLQRIESAVEAMSEQVERISEGQRFVTKVLAERSSAQS
jgi:hypothetical protein